MCTRAVLPVHVYGHPVDMDRLLELASRRQPGRDRGLRRVPRRHRARPNAAFGPISASASTPTRSSRPAKGAWFSPTTHRWLSRFGLRNLCFGTPRFLHQELGFSLRMTGFQAAMGLVQLRKIDRILEQKRRVAHTYNRSARSTRLACGCPWNAIGHLMCIGCTAWSSKMIFGLAAMS